jgi:hypothetical protein
MRRSCELACYAHRAASPAGFFWGAALTIACSSPVTERYSIAAGSGGAAGNVIANGGGGLGLAAIDASATAASDAANIPLVTPCTGRCTDFPAAPILYAGNGATPPPANAAGLFGAPGSGGGPCLLEPEPDALYPRNWLRARLAYKPGPGQDLFELRIHSNQEANDLVVYTTQSTWYIPKDIWTAVSSHIADDWTFTAAVRGIESGRPGAMPSLASKVTFSIAPSTADGSIVYWVTGGAKADGGIAGPQLKGFAVGDENVVSVMEPSSLGEKPECLGCHTSTPDGEFIGMSVSDVASDGTPAYIQIRRGKAPNDAPAFISAPAQTLLARRYQQLPVFSKAHWADGDHVMLSMLDSEPSGKASGPTRIIWTDLEAKSTDEGAGWGVIARTNDTLQAGGAVWSHDGTKIAYTSSSSVASGINEDSGDGNIIIVPYNNRQGGMGTPLAGASDSKYNEYYPAFSVDDRLVAFNRVAVGQTSQNDLNAEVFIVPTEGGSPQRLSSNDPADCAQFKSPGITNSWVRWSPQAQTINGKTYYWMIFSSRRLDGGNPQLYATGIVSTGGTLKTHGALYLWNQPSDERNHTPAWDLFEIVPTPPPTVIR